MFPSPPFTTRGPTTVTGAAVPRAGRASGGGGA